MTKRPIQPLTVEQARLIRRKIDAASPGTKRRVDEHLAAALGGPNPPPLTSRRQPPIRR